LAVTLKRNELHFGDHHMNYVLCYKIVTNQYILLQPEHKTANCRLKWSVCFM